MALRKSPEEKAQREVDLAAAEFRASPVGCAAEAYNRGDGFVEIRVDRRDNPEFAALLSDIEIIGWTLEHVSYIESNINTNEVAIYLFRRKDEVVVEPLAKLRTPRARRTPDMSK